MLLAGIIVLLIGVIIWGYVGTIETWENAKVFFDGGQPYCLVRPEAGRIVMSNKLKSLFEYQKFEQNPKLAEMIEDTESRYGILALSDENLYMVAAAGEPKNYVPGLDGETKRELM